MTNDSHSTPGLMYGCVAAGSLGALVGLASAGVGWYFGWPGTLDPAALAVLFGGSLAVGAAWGVALFFPVGWLGSLVKLLEGKAGFAPSFFVLFVGLVGTAVGFWWQFPSGDPLAIAVWSAEAGLASVVAVCTLGVVLIFIFDYLLK